MIRIDLTPEQLTLGARAGVDRHISAILNKNRRVADMNYMVPGTWEKDVIGAMAEMAVSYYFNLAWTGAARLDAVDVGDCIQVRAIQEANHRLIIRPGDKHLHLPYVLALYERPRSFVLLGWIFGHDGKRIGTFDSPNERDECHWVTQQQLRPIDELFTVMFKTNAAQTQAKAG
jgi:hypothetical protein